MFIDVTLVVNKVWVCARMAHRKGYGEMDVSSLFTQELINGF